MGTHGVSPSRPALKDISNNSFAFTVQKSIARDRPSKKDNDENKNWVMRDPDSEPEKLTVLTKGRRVHALASTGCPPVELRQNHEGQEASFQDASLEHRSSPKCQKSRALSDKASTPRLTGQQPLQNEATTSLMFSPSSSLPPTSSPSIPAVLESDPDYIQQLWEAVFRFNRTLVAVAPDDTMSQKFPALKFYSRAAFGPMDEVFNGTTGSVPAERSMLHHVSSGDIADFMGLIKRAILLPELKTTPELIHATYLLFRNTNMPKPTIDPTSEGGKLVAIRILGASPDAQDEEQSLWRAAPTYQTDDDALHPSRVDGGGIQVMDISFWLLIEDKNLPPGLQYNIACVMGTFHGLATAPYLSVFHCTRANCFHRDVASCEALRNASRLGNTSLYNRYLLREETTFVTESFSMKTDDVAHFTVVMG